MTGSDEGWGGGAWHTGFRQGQSPSSLLSLPRSPPTVSPASKAPPGLPLCSGGAGPALLMAASCELESWPKPLAELAGSPEQGRWPRDAGSAASRSEPAARTLEWPWQSRGLGPQSCRDGRVRRILPWASFPWGSGEAGPLGQRTGRGWREPGAAVSGQHCGRALKARSAPDSSPRRQARTGLETGPQR